MLKNAPKVETTEYQQGKRPSSCLLIPKTTPQGGLKPEAKTTCTFGLQVLSLCYKKQKNVHTSRMMFDPLVSMLKDCFYCSKCVLVIDKSLKVLCQILNFPIPSLEMHVSKISSGMIILLLQEQQGEIIQSCLHLVSDCHSVGERDESLQSGDRLTAGNIITLTGHTGDTQVVGESGGNV